MASGSAICWGRSPAAADLIGGRRLGALAVGIRLQELPIGGDHVATDRGFLIAQPSL